jgi:hypothetical protein
MSMLWQCNQVTKFKLFSLINKNKDMVFIYLNPIYNCKDNHYFYIDIDIYIYVYSIHFFRKILLVENFAEWF